MSEDASAEYELLVADVYELSGALRRTGDTIATAHGQTQARWQLLSAVSAHPQSVARAARRLGVSRQAVQRVADDLVVAGTAEYRVNPDHRSSPLLALTKDGERTLAAINQAASQANRAIAEHLTTDVLDAMRAGVKTLLAALESTSQSSSS